MRSGHAVPPRLWRALLPAPPILACCLSVLVSPFDADAAALPNDGGLLIPRAARQLDKIAPNFVGKLAGSATSIQLGINRGGATVCSGDGYGGPLGQYAEWFEGDEFYASFQDPGEFGNCEGATDLHPVDVTAINWWIVSNSPAVYEMQPLVYENIGDLMWAIPGNVQCAGPLYVIDLSAVTAVESFVLNLPFPDQCCQFDPFFAGVYVPTLTGSGFLGLVVDDDGATEHWQYNDYGSGFEDLTVEWGFVGDVFLWADALAFDQNSCPGFPGVCDWQSWLADPIAEYWTDPNSYGQTEYFVRFQSDTPCTLNTARFLFYCPGVAGTPTVRVRVYGSNGPVRGSLEYPDLSSDGANFLGFADIPFGDLACYPAYTEVDLSFLGPFVSGAGETFFITCSLSPLTPNPGTDVAAFLTSAGNGGGLGPNPRSGSYVGTLGDYYYFGEAFSGGQRELAIDAFMCCEEPPPTTPPCNNPGPDDWNTWAHDYQRTSWSNVEVGDPCQVTAVWTRTLNRLSNFCEPTAAGNWVYISSDDKLCSFDLASGSPGRCVGGIPYIFGSNRGNATIEGGFLYITGGTARSFSKWTADLSRQLWIYGIPVGTPLSGEARFGVTAVYSVGGTEIVIVGDDNNRLYAFKASDGFLYPGWPANPVVLTGAARHSPAYDGAGTLYVGTAEAATNLNGRIYSINAATGAINWVYDDPNLTDEGYPGGVSYEDGFVYAASMSYDLSGRRVKLDAAGNEIWNRPQARSLYGAPTIGRNLLFMGQELGGQGVLVIDKHSGNAIYNFALDGVGDVSQHVTLTCDGYLFAGDRQGRWWLLDANDLEAEWFVQFNGIVNGTAIATHPGTGENYAVVGVRSGAPGIPTVGYVAAFRFNAGPRPRVRQLTASVTIPAPFNSGSGNLYTVPDALENIGCADLTLSQNILDPDPEALAFDDSLSLYATSTAESMVGDDYLTYFPGSKTAYLRSRPRQLVDAELTRGDVSLENAANAMAQGQRNGRRLSASASVVRTSGISHNPVLPPGGKTDVTWQWDGTGLGRGTDVEQIEFVTNDPDAVLLGGHPRLTITYVGGCPPEDTVLHFGILNSERVYNSGSLGVSRVEENFIWEGIDENLYSGSLVVCGDSIVGHGAQVHSVLYEDVYELPGQFLPNPGPAGACGFDAGAGVALGYRRTGGCPGSPTEILGEWTRSSYADSNLRADPGSPLAAIGLNVIQTEVGAYDPLYGDFKLVRWEFQNRDDNPKTIHAGSHIDWDPEGLWRGDAALVSDIFNGYVIWKALSGTVGFGALDPAQTSTWQGINPQWNPPRRIHVLEFGSWAWGCIYEECPTTAEYWHLYVNRVPTRLVDDLVNSNGDASGILINGAVFVPPSGAAAIHQALFGVDASSLDPAIIEANGLDVAKRAARWAGFARGDVNDDGIINLVDVCWLTSGHPIYPDSYCGDVDLSGTVDAADQVYLLDFVTGIGPAPLGEWRFTF